MSISRLKNIYNKVKKQFREGAINVTGVTEENIKKYEFMKYLMEKSGLYLNDFYQKSRSRIPIDRIPTFTESEAVLAEQVLRAVLARAYQLGCCIEQATVVFTESLEAGIKEPLEIVDISGKPIKPGFKRMVDGVLRSHAYVDHSVVFSGRDTSTPLTIDLSRLKGITVSDTWREGFFCEYKKEEFPKEKDLTGGYFSLDKIVSYCRADRNLTEIEWNALAYLLLVLQKFITQNFLSYCNECKKPFDESMRELKQIHELFDDKIATYKKLGNTHHLFATTRDFRAKMIIKQLLYDEFQIKHWKNPNISFQPTSKPTSIMTTSFLKRQ